MTRSPGGDAAFRSLYASTFDPISRYCLRRLPADAAKDAVAEVFLIAWRRSDEVPRGGDALPWLYGVARNVVRNSLRSHRRSERLRRRLTAEPSQNDPGLEPLVVRREEERRLVQALASLPPTDQEIVRLRAFEELTFAQIGSVVGCSEDAAKKRLSRALDRLRSAAEHHPPGTVAALPRATRRGDER